MELPRLAGRHSSIPLALPDSAATTAAGSRSPGCDQRGTAPTHGSASILKFTLSTLVARKPFALIEPAHSLPPPNTDNDAHPPLSTVKVPIVGFVQLWPGVSTCPTRHALPLPLLSTVTEIRCVALSPPASSAVTVTVAVPAAAGVRVTALPDTLTLTLLRALDLAAYVRLSPSPAMCPTAPPPGTGLHSVCRRHRHTVFRSRSTWCATAQLQRPQPAADGLPPTEPVRPSRPPRASAAPERSWCLSLPRKSPPVPQAVEATSPQ